MSRGWYRAKVCKWRSPADHFSPVEASFPDMKYPLIGFIEASGPAANYRTVLDREAPAFGQERRGVAPLIDLGFLQGFQTCSQVLEGG